MAAGGRLNQAEFKTANAEDLARPTAICGEQLGRSQAVASTIVSWYKANLRVVQFYNVVF